MTVALGLGLLSLSLWNIITMKARYTNFGKLKGDSLVMFFALFVWLGYLASLVSKVSNILCLSLHTIHCWNKETTILFEVSCKHSWEGKESSFLNTYVTIILFQEIVAQKTLDLLREDKTAYIFPFCESKMDPVTLTMMVTLGSIGVGSCKAFLQNFKVSSRYGFCAIRIGTSVYKKKSKKKKPAVDVFDPLSFSSIDQWIK